MKKIVLVFVALALLALIRPVFAILGDVDGDGIVDMTDVGLIARCYLATPSSPRWNPACDLSGDGIIDMADIGIVAANFGMGF